MTINGVNGNQKLQQVEVSRQGEVKTAETVAAAEIGNELTKNATNEPLEGEISFMKECTDGVDDGEISLKEKGKALLEGGKRFFKNMVCDENGNFSLKQTAKTVATVAVVAGATAAVVAAGIVTAPVAAAVLVAGGVVAGTAGIIKGAVNAADAKTDAEAKEAYAEIGEGATLTAISLIPAKSVIKGVKGKGAPASAKPAVKTKTEILSDGTVKVCTIDKKTGEVLSAENSFNGIKTTETFENGKLRTKTVIDRNGNKSVNIYNDLNQPVSYSKYNKNGELLKQQKIEYLFGKTKVTEMDGSYSIGEGTTFKFTITNFDANGKQISQTISTNKNGTYKAVTTYSDGRVKTVWDRGGVVDASSTYPTWEVLIVDNQGKLLQQTLYKGHIKKYEFLKNPEGGSSYTHYSDDGKISFVTRYDALGNLVDESKL